MTLATLLLFHWVFTIAIALLLKKWYRFEMSRLFTAESISVLEASKGARTIPFSVTVERPQKGEGRLVGTPKVLVRSLVRWLIYGGSGLGVLYLLDVLFFSSTDQSARWEEYSLVIGLMLVVLIIGGLVRTRVAFSGLWIISFMAGVALGSTVFGIVFFSIPTFIEYIRRGLLSALLAIPGVFLLLFMIVLGFIVVGLMIFGLLWAHRLLMQYVPASPAYVGMVFFWAWLCYFSFSSQLPMGEAEFEKVAKFLLLPLIFYSAATFSLLWVLKALFPTGRPIRLLYLRSFLRNAKSERFFRSLVRKWTEFGSVFVLCGPDIVNATLDSRMLTAHLTFNLEEEFISDIDDLKDRLEAVRTVRNWDLLYTVEEFKCLGSVWTSVFRELFKRCDVVLLDLRGFDKSHTGTAFELFTIIQSGQTHKTLFLCDETTNITSAEEIGRAALAQAGNDMKRGAQGITLVETSDSAYRTRRLAVPLLVSMVMANSEDVQSPPQTELAKVKPSERKTRATATTKPQLPVQDLTSILGSPEIKKKM